MKKDKVLFVYEEDGAYKIESLWAEKSGDGYKILNAPFFVKNVSYGDVVSVELDDGELYFDSLLEESGHSTVQLIFFNKENIKDITDTLVRMGCDWEGSHIKELISVDVPKEVIYSSVQNYLDSLEEQEIISYREACISSMHRS
jgi:hypothetical protein